MNTQKINKEDCKFTVLNHPSLGRNTGGGYMIKMTYDMKSYLMYHSMIAFRTQDQVTSFSCARKVGKKEGQRIIDALPNILEIFA